MKTDLQRIIRSGLLNFSRNTVLSFSAVFMMVITLLIISGTIFFHAILGYSVAQIKNRVDVNVYFYPVASETSILKLKNTLEQLPSVASIEYISRDQALESFRAKHSNDALTLQALAELGTNPLGASLNIRAKESDQYETIANYLSSSDTLDNASASIIEKVNYYQNADIIKRMTSVSQAFQKIGFIVITLFVILSLVIVHTLIRLTIYASREEIHVMRLVGAQKRYIHGPFMVEGFITGLVASFITIILLYPISLYITKNTTTFLQGFSVVGYYGDNFIQIFVMLMVIGITIGVVSAGWSVHRFMNHHQE